MFRTSGLFHKETLVLQYFAENFLEDSHFHPFALPTPPKALFNDIGQLLNLGCKCEVTVSECKYEAATNGHFAFCDDSLHSALQISHTATRR